MVYTKCWGSWRGKGAGWIVILLVDVRRSYTFLKIVFLWVVELEIEIPLSFNALVSDLNVSKLFTCCTEKS